MDTLKYLTEGSIAEEGLKDLFTKKQRERKNDKNSKAYKSIQEKTNLNAEGFKYRKQLIDNFSPKIKNIIKKYSSKIPSLKYVSDPENIEDNEKFFNGKVNYFIMAEYKLSENIEPTEDDAKTINTLRKFADEVEQLFTKQYFVRVNTMKSGVCIFDTNTSPKPSTESIDIIASLSDPDNIAEEGIVNGNIKLSSEYKTK